MRLWGGRFGDGPDARMADFTRSIEVDSELALDDIAGSIAHVRGLARAGLVTSEEAEHLERGLVSLRDDVVAGSIVWDPALEDVHMNLETLLTERVGALGGKLHTGRSRNDQVATDLRLWTRRAVGRLDAGIIALEGALVDLAEREGDAVLPGTTHIQPAQPILFAHHLLAYVEMLERDRGRLADAKRRLNLSPLGAGALAGAGYPLDRATTAAELGFDGVTANSLDATSDRDFVVEVMAAVAYSWECDRGTYPAFQYVTPGRHLTTMDHDFTDMVTELAARGKLERVAAFRQLQALSHLTYLLTRKTL